MEEGPVVEVEVPDPGPDEVLLNEGKVRIIVPRSGVGGPKGPAQKGPVFYNPAMEFNRDVTVALVRTLPERKRRKVLDGLAGTGVRGLRIAKEAGQTDSEVVINDINPKAFKAIQKNIELNNMDGVLGTRRPVNALVHDETFNYIDIDPYGTPVPFLDAAIQASGRGALGITATDTATLCGSSSVTCLRRYGAHATRSHFMHEAGLRILIGFVITHAARFDKAASPLLSHSTDHYMRIYVSLEKGAYKAKELLELMGYTVLHKSGLFETFTMEQVEDRYELPRKAKLWGPLWTGPLHDKRVLKKLKISQHVSTPSNFSKALGLWKDEVDFSPMFHDVDELSRRIRPEPPRMTTILESIEDAGHKAARTQFSPKGFKTDMPFDELVSIFEKM